MRVCKANDGKRFILMAAGCAEIGWMPGAFLVTEAGSNDLDYHASITRP
jgi:hypothetical protein